MHKNPSLQLSVSVEFVDGVVIEIFVVSPLGVDDELDESWIDSIVVVSAKVVVDTGGKSVEELCSPKEFAAKKFKKPT